MNANSENSKNLTTRKSLRYMLDVRATNASVCVSMRRENRMQGF